MQVSPWLVIVVAAAACGGTDVNTMPNDRDSTKPDAGGGSTHVADAMPVPPDGIPANLTPCEEAVYHSDLAWIQAQVFDVSCTTMCHGDTPPAASMSLRAGEARASLVNVRSTQFPDWIRVVPGSPAQSMLMVQLGGEPGPALEGLMPWGMPKLCDEKIDAIRRWIAAGANP
jgi:hypothetical protein